MPAFNLFYFLFVVCLGFLVGCRPAEVDKRADKDLGRDIERLSDIQGQVQGQREIRQIYDSVLYTDLSEELGKRKKRGLEESMAEANRITDPHEKDLALSQIVEQLALDAQYSEATITANKIVDAKLKDRLFEEIARFQLKGVLALQRNSPKSAPSEDKPTVSEAVSANIRQILDSVKQISDPWRRVETLLDIAMVRFNMSDKDGTFETIQLAVESASKIPEGDTRKPHALCQLARWMARLDEKPSAQKLCDEASAVLDKPNKDTPENKTAILMELAAVETLLANEKGALKHCHAAASMTQQIENPQIKASVLLGLARMILLYPPAGDGVTTAESLLKTKKLVMTAAKILAGLTPMERTESTLKQPIGSNEMISVLVFPWQELEKMKNDVLLKIAKMQAWGSPLEDVWETVQDITDVPTRDAALAEAITMMIATQKTDDAEAWLDEVSSPVRKEQLKILLKK